MQIEASVTEPPRVAKSIGHVYYKYSALRSPGQFTRCCDQFRFGRSPKSGDAEKERRSEGAAGARGQIRQQTPLESRRVQGQRSREGAAEQDSRRSPAREQ